MLADISRADLAYARSVWYRQLDYHPKLGQRLLDEAVDSGKRFCGYFTPPQDGKSFGIAKHAGGYLIVPETHIWIVAPKYEDGAKEFMYLYDDLAVTRQLGSALRKHHDVRGGNMCVELRNKSWVQVVSISEGSDNLRKEQVDVVIFAEASKLPANPLPGMFSRLEKRRGLAFWPSTHKGYGWMWDEVAVRSMPVKPKTGAWGPWEHGRREILHGETNPDYDPEYWSCQVSYVPEFGNVLHQGAQDTGFTHEQIARARLRLPPPMFAEQFGGEAASYQGLVYPFDPTKHECDPFDIPRDWTHIVGYDHGAGGGSDPTAILLGSYSPDGTLYFWREIYDTEIRAVSARAGMLRTALSGRSATIMRGRDAKQVAKELSDAGFASSYPRESEISARLIRMTSLMQENRWKVFRGRCPNLKREILAYEWDEKNPGKPKDGNDHALEAAGMASLAPVALPDASTGRVPLSEDADTLSDRILRDRVWGDWKKEQQAEAEARRWADADDLLNPNPLEDDPQFVEAFVP